MLCRHLSSSRDERAMPEAGAGRFDGVGSAAAGSLGPSSRSGDCRRLADAAATLVGVAVPPSAAPDNDSDRSCVTVGDVGFALRRRGAHRAAEQIAAGGLIRKSHSGNRLEQTLGDQSRRRCGVWDGPRLASGASSVQIRRRTPPVARHAAEGVRWSAPGRKGGACCVHQLAIRPAAAVAPQQKVVQDGSGGCRASAGSRGNPLPNPRVSKTETAQEVTQRERGGVAQDSAGRSAPMRHCLVQC